MQKQSTSHIIMVPPDHFGFNPETAATNPFQHNPQTFHKSTKEIRDAAFVEFTNMVEKLRQYHIDVSILSNRTDVSTPDALFPNNWFSTHQEGLVVFYPLLTPNRRLERQQDALWELFKKKGIEKPRIIDLTHDEEKGLILESTGSMVLDRVNKVAFAMASARTIGEEFEKWCKLMGYEEVYIRSTYHHQKEVYHTNIAMSIGSEFIVICLDVIDDEKEKEKIRQRLKSLGKEIIEISLEQVYTFCGNILELQSKEDKKLIIMSETACDAFTKEQRERLKQYGELVPFAIPTIEAVGGGGVRCMIAEIFF